MKQFNSTLNRYTPLKATKDGLARKAIRKRALSKEHWKRAATRLMREYHATHERCAVCGISAFRLLGPERVLELHHICGRGSARHECFENYLMLCGREHRHFHSGGEFSDAGERFPKLTGGHLLWAKEQADGPLDVALLASLRGWQGLPDDWLPCRLPEAFIIERERNL